MRTRWSHIGPARPLTLAHRLSARAGRGTDSTPAFEPLESRQLLAAIVWTGAGDGSTWNNPDNWQSAGATVVPGAGDDVTIANVPPLLDLGAEARARNVTILGSTSLRGALEVGALLTWQGSGASSLEGAITGPAADIKISAGSLSLAGQISAGKTNRISAPVTLRGDARLAGDTDLDLPAAIDGAFNLTLAGAFAPGERMSLGAIGQQLAPRSVSITGPAALSNVTTSGSLSVAGAATLNGNVEVLAGDTVTFAGLTLGGRTLTVFARQVDLTGRVTGPGFLNLRPLTADQGISVADTPLAGDLDITQAELDLLDVSITQVEIGRLDGYANLHIGNAVVYASTTFIMAGSSSSGQRGLPPALTTFGSVSVGTVTGGSTNTGVTVRGSEATTSLSGYIRTRGGPINIIDAVRLVDDAAELDSTFNGEFAGAPVTIVFALNSEAQELNDLTINSGDGAVTLDGPVGAAPDGQLGQLIINGRGGINLNSPTIVTKDQQVYNGPVTIGNTIVIVNENAPVVFTQSVGGPGTLEIAPGTGETTFGGEVFDFALLIIDGGSSRTFAQPVSVGELRVLGGRIDFDGGATVRTALVAGGVLSGTGAILITAGLTWTGGSLEGAGDLTLAAGSRSSIEGESPKQLARTLVNAGLLSSSGAVTFVAATLRNTEGGVVILLPGSDWSSVTGGVIENAGLIRVRGWGGAGGGGAARLAGVGVQGAGTLEVESGRLNIEPAGGVFAAQGVIVIDAGAVLYVDGDVDLSVAAELSVGIAGPALNGLLFATGNVTTGGTLRVLVADGYTPAIEDGFLLIRSSPLGTPVAAFATVIAPTFGGRTLSQAAWIGGLQVRFGGSLEFNNDGFFNLDDVGDFITAYYSEEPDPRADFNQDGVVNDLDLSDFLRAYYVGQNTPAPTGEPTPSATSA